jgi:hypothetical protein
MMMKSSDKTRSDTPYSGRTSFLHVFNDSRNHYEKILLLLFT